jgi:hypothetical protein
MVQASKCRSLTRATTISTARHCGACPCRTQQAPHRRPLTRTRAAMRISRHARVRHLLVGQQQAWLATAGVVKVSAHLLTCRPSTLVAKLAFDACARRDTGHERSRTRALQRRGAAPGMLTWEAGQVRPPRSRRRWSRRTRSRTQLALPWLDRPTGARRSWQRPVSGRTTTSRGLALGRIGP